MMLVFFFGMGAAALLVSVTRSPMQMALALALLGCFASIYHPVGIPMLVQGAARPGWTIGINGLVGNLGRGDRGGGDGLPRQVLRLAHGVRHPRRRCAIAVGVAFALLATRGGECARRRQGQRRALPSGVPMARLLLVMTVAATTGSLLFNFSTNSNYELLSERLRSILAGSGAASALLLAVVYTVASVAQLVVGHLIDRVPLKAPVPRHRRAAGGAAGAVDPGRRLGLLRRCSCSSWRRSSAPSRSPTR